MESVNGVSQNNTNVVNATNQAVYKDNVHMKNAPLNVGVIVPPDDHYNPVLYSDVKATAAFNQLNRDIYQGVKKSKNINEKETPLSIKILAGIAASAAIIWGIVKLIRR